ncbi:hypothetical protein [Cupriavidus campinensis]|uniref:Lipoprotein n=1 Tax=Cupriavidus campinensis TaxID=151783 RepID=A0AAE9L248_9BURK|nr:hypothetical protein [Cupriavidus campinensis]URF05457.1 hypothetical protein M5D45_06535 [Cupriavidus campinensis]
MRKMLLVVGACLLTLQGCATKNYGRQGNLTSIEKETMTCREIQLEQAKVMGFTQYIDKESAFDGRDVLAFLGDFGIGNAIEKDAAVDSAKQRHYQLEVAAYEKGCTTVKPEPLEDPLKYKSAS